MVGGEQRTSVCLWGEVVVLGVVLLDSVCGGRGEQSVKQPGTD